VGGRADMTGRTGVEIRGKERPQKTLHGPLVGRIGLGPVHCEQDKTCQTAKDGHQSFHQEKQMRYAISPESATALSQPAIYPIDVFRTSASHKCFNGMRVFA